jgi:hypothetical protein
MADKRSKRQAAEAEIIGLWRRRPDDQRLFRHTEPFITGLESSRRDLVQALGGSSMFYQRTMDLIRFLTTDSK